MEFSAKTDIGNIKDNNEDSFITISNENVSIFAVADGMGGHDFGEEASHIAVTYIKESDKDSLCQETIKDYITDIFNKINEKIHLTGLMKNSVLGMGTTLTMAVIMKNHMFIGHVGDSRLYLINQTIRQLTKDHSYVEELIDKGMITEKEAKTHPKKNIITRALGTAKRIAVDIIEQPLNDKDILLICSDGLSNMLEDSEIKEIVDVGDSLDITNEKMIKIAKERGGYDNITVITVKNI
ncbi:MAG: Stp1/IreP family PP2C-type Ser/Thr phosphatase [Clostridia bacterium]|nr:Stp1/IreP family PP2C-type Ser/Thr phosphatase [Clostridia bacterium]